MFTNTLTIKDTLKNPTINTSTGANTPIPYFLDKSNNNYRYKVWIYLEGPQLAFVDYVVYKLPSDFSVTDTRIPRTVVNPNCSFFIWTNTVFNMLATIYMKSGDVQNIEHYLTFNSEIEQNKYEFRSSGSME